MLDKKWLINNREMYEESCRKRNIGSDFENFEQLYKNFQDLTAKFEEKRAQQNKIQGACEESRILKEEIANLTEKRRQAQEELENWMLNCPNILLEDVPAGKDEKENQIIFRSEIPAKIAEKKGIHHYDLVDNLIMKEEAINISGSRFVIFKHALSKLKRALSEFMLELNASQGYEEYTVPYVVNQECLFGTGQLPKFAEDAFCTTQNKWLISTGEISLVNLFRDYVFEPGDLPKLCMTFSPCFRSEAGAAGRDTKGIIRLHQFHKVELVTICLPEQAEELHQKKLKAATTILEKLGLAYQILLLCGGDSGFTASKQYDVEVWMPGLGRYLEIASCSQCSSFQAIRTNIRYKGETKTAFVHTLNGSALPIERLVAAIIENFSNEDGSISIPEVLHNLIGGNTITKDGKIISL